MKKSEKICGMTYEPGSFERYMKNVLKKRKMKEDQEILDEMMSNLKKKHETEKQQQIDDLTKKLEKIKG